MPKLAIHGGTLVRREPLSSNYPTKGCMYTSRVKMWRILPKSGKR
jgi:hypothetical protein